MYYTVKGKHKNTFHICTKNV